MAKSTNKTPKVEKPKKQYNVKGKMNGLYSLIVALAELATAYVFVTQDNKILLPLAIILGVDASQRFARAFIK